MGLQFDVKDETLAKWADRIIGGLVALTLWLIKKFLITGYGYYSEHKDKEMTLKLKHFVGLQVLSAVIVALIVVAIEKIFS